MYNPKISVIIVVYNAKKQLELTLNSVISQLYSNIELIVVDGGSTDGTINIIKQHENHIAKWISESDEGIYDAMNKGVKFATGDFVYFLGAGDVIYNVLTDVASKLKNTDTIYYGNVYRNDTRKIYDGKFSSYKLAVKNICHQSIFYPKKVFQLYQYNTKYNMQADHDLNMKCFGNKDLVYQYIPLTVSVYEGGGISATKLDIPFFLDKLLIVKDNFPYAVYLYVLLRDKIARLLRFKNYIA